MIHLEPRKLYDAAIVGHKKETDQLVYDRCLLIDALIEKYMSTHADLSVNDAYIMAVDHISYNIEGMRLNYSDWPIIRDTDGKSKEE